MFRCLLAICIGTGVAALVGEIVDGRGLYTTLLVVCAVLVGPLIAAVVIGRVLSGSSLMHADKIEAARQAGRIGLARVLAIRRTGTMINHEPVCVLDLLVVPESGHAPYQTSLRKLISIVDLAAMQPGTVLVVAQLAADRPEVAIIGDPDPVWRHRAEVDERVRSLPGAPVWDPSARGVRDAYGRLHIPRPVFFVLALGTAAATLIPAYGQIGWLLRGETMFKKDNAAHAVEAITADVGSKFFKVSLYPSSIKAEIPTSPGALTTDDICYEHGRVIREGATPIQPNPEEVPRALFDADEVDWTVVPAIVAEAQRRSGIQAGAEDPMVIVGRPVPLDGSAPQFTVYVRDDYHNAWFTFAADGTLIAMRGDTPSPSTPSTPTPR